MRNLYRYVVNQSLLVTKRVQACGWTKLRRTCRRSVAPTIKLNPKQLRFEGKFNFLHMWESRYLLAQYATV